MARLTVLLLAVVLPGIGAWVGWSSAGDVVRLAATMPEAGGWKPGYLTATVNQPLRLRVTSNDVVHGFAIGQSDRAAIDIAPGQVVDITVSFSRPGTYTYYCTRWCGPNHWRMRGTIEVSGPPDGLPPNPPPPPYLTLGIDPDAPHPVDVRLDRAPSAERVETLGLTLPSEYLARDSLLARSPLAVWQSLRARDSGTRLEDADLWDLVALIWQRHTTAETVRRGKRLYRENCAACHGVAGRGDGPMAGAFVDWQRSADHVDPVSGMGNDIVEPADFTRRDLLGAAPAALHGKILRGGMGTGMPYWGPIFTDAQIWALIDYLWTFQFSYNEGDTEQ